MRKGRPGGEVSRVPFIPRLSVATPGSNRAYGAVILRTVRPAIAGVARARAIKFKSPSEARHNAHRSSYALAFQLDWPSEPRNTRNWPRTSCYDLSKICASRPAKSEPNGNGTDSARSEPELTKSRADHAVMKAIVQYSILLGFGRWEHRKTRMWMKRC